jgi:hypothetical protein
MYYAIIRQVVTSAEAEYTGVVYDNITDNVFDGHKSQGFFIEPMDYVIRPINEDEIREYEISQSINIESASGDIPETTIAPMPIYQQVTKNDAYKAIKFYIENYKDKENEKMFIYNGHEYYSDVKAIQATQNQCLTMNDTDNIPVQNGAWKTAEVDGNNNPVFQVLTVAEFKTLAKTLFDRGASNFSVKELHINTLRTMVNDDTKTITDILNYDYSTGWNG